MPTKTLTDAEKERLVAAARLAVADERDEFFDSIMKELGLEIDASTESEEEVEVKPRRKK